MFLISAVPLLQASPQSGDEINAERIAVALDGNLVPTF